MLLPNLQTSVIPAIVYRQALWPNDVTADPRVAAAATIARLREDGPSRLRVSHGAWWHAFWPTSFLSIPVTRVEGFYWVEMFVHATTPTNSRSCPDLLHSVDDRFILLLYALQPFYMCVQTHWGFYALCVSPSLCVHDRIVTIQTLTQTHHTLHPWQVQDCVVVA